LVGPTASGKTAAALALAARWPVEVVSVDSALVYRGMDIGTAKPTAAELAQVRHHLIDIRDPGTPYSAADFARDATAALSDITQRGRIPLLVGGTMLYLRALYQGLDDLPAANPALRAHIEQDAAALGWPALHAQLALVDPATAARLAPADAQRIGRALEVYRLTGQPLSALQTSNSIAANAMNSGATVQKDWNIGPGSLLLSLEPQNRAWLHGRVAQRLAAMRAQGFVAEVRRLRARGDLTPDLPALRSVGYRQAWAALDALGADASDDAVWAALLEPALAATRQLAKRQLTWLRSQPQRHVVACDAPDALAQVLAAAAPVAQTLLTRAPGAATL
jgi:tRNA dimethylallyltransferase